MTHSLRVATSLRLLSSIAGLPTSAPAPSQRRSGHTLPHRAQAITVTSAVATVKVPDIRLPDGQQTSKALVSGHRSMPTPVVQRSCRTVAPSRRPAVTWTDGGSCRAPRSQSGVRRSGSVRDLPSPVREDMREWVCVPLLLSSSAVKIVGRHPNRTRALPNSASASRRYRGDHGRRRTHQATNDPA
jgi:hypothetical protein